jgi:hypothetical protein
MQNSVSAGFDLKLLSIWKFEQFLNLSGSSNTDLLQ